MTEIINKHLYKNVLFTLLISLKFLMVCEVQCYAPSRFHCNYHTVHSRIDRSTLIHRLKYSYTLYAKLEWYLLRSYLINTWFIFVTLQSMSLKLPRPKQLYFVLYFVFEWTVLVYKFAYWSNIACTSAGKITQRHLVKAENAISNCEIVLFSRKNINIDLRLY